jgi:hypothetical protein
MIISVEIPDELATQLIPSGQDPARALLEAIAVEGYRTDRLSEGEVRQRLGFGTRMQGHELVKQRGVFLH